MDVLILGGTQFVGRHLTAAALAGGHRVTLFNRGSNQDVFPEVERLIGDRNEDLSALGGRSWDAAIDTCGYFVRQLRSSTEALKGSVNHYTFISSISVYADRTKAFQDENAPLATLEDETTEEVTAETYGGLKVVCEEVVRSQFPNALNLRPGIVVGPYDHTDRFSYWPARTARGGEMLAPGKQDSPVQFIDGRDLAEWTLRLIEAQRTGTFNVVTTPDEVSFGGLLETSREVSGSDAKFTWLPDDFLLSSEVERGSELPFWIPGAESNFMRVSSKRALAAGLKTRALETTVRDTLEWLATLPTDRAWQAGMSPEREAQLLTRWRER